MLRVEMFPKPNVSNFDHFSFGIWGYIILETKAQEDVDERGVSLSTMDMTADVQQSGKAFENRLCSAFSTASEAVRGVGKVQNV